MIDDGQWTYTWDAENRLVTMIASAAAVDAGQPNLWIDFKYDYLGRRVEKKVTNVSTNTVGIWRRYVYDGWSMVAEYSVSSLSPLVLGRSYTWGLDIARSLADAGGVGALLQIADHASGKQFMPTYDGNGNIASLINANTGSVAAVYEYGPFGETIRADVNDSSIADQPFRFSTKYLDAETGYYDYGHRYYSPSQGRFLGRDPTEEKGGLHLYAFCLNNAINRWDVLGMYTVDHTQYGVTYFTGDADSSWTLSRVDEVWGQTYYKDSSGGIYSTLATRSASDFIQMNIDNPIDSFGDVLDQTIASASTGWSGWNGSGGGYDTSSLENWSAECAAAFDADAEATVKAAAAKSKAPNSGLVFNQTMPGLNTSLLANPATLSSATQLPYSLRADYSWPAPVSGRQFGSGFAAMTSLAGVSDRIGTKLFAEAGGYTFQANDGTWSYTLTISNTPRGVDVGDPPTANASAVHKHVNLNADSHHPSDADYYWSAARGGITDYLVRPNGDVTPYFGTPGGGGVQQPPIWNVRPPKR